MLFKKNMSKRGQLTLFLILGLTLLIAVVAIFFIFKKTESSEELTESVPEEFKPVSSYVEKCIHDISLDGIKKMGAHGGYIDPLDPKLTGKNLKYFAASPDRGDIISFTNSKEDLIPYYVHVPGKASFNNYDLATAAPSLEEMQNQLQIHLVRNVPNCTISFSNNQYSSMVIEQNPESIRPKVIIKESNVEIYLSYDVNITKESKKTSITSFSSVVNVPLKKYYDLAMLISQAEALTQFQESFTSNLISYYSGLEREKLPPRYASTDTLDIITWSNQEQKIRMNSLLNSYVPAIKVVDATSIIDEENYETDVEKSFYSSMHLKIFEENSKEQITFFYRDGTLNMKINPSQGDLIKPNIDSVQGNNMIPSKKINSYKFSYDLSYPIIVEIRSTNNLDSELQDYSYLFAIESNLIEDKPPLAWMLGFGTSEWDSSSLSQKISIPGENGDIVDLEQWTSSKTLFCDESTWSGGNITLSTKDNSQESIPGVGIIFSCGNYAECFIGETNVTGGFNSKTPICNGGKLILFKEGFGSKKIDFSSVNERAQNLGNFNLDKSIKVSTSVIKKQISKSYLRNDDWIWQSEEDSLSQSMALEANDQVVLTLSSLDDEEYGTSAILLFGKDGLQNQEISIVPGRYSVSASLIKYDPISIPAKCSRFCESKYLGVIGCSQYSYYPEEPIVMDPAMWGGVELSEVTITPQDLISGRIEFSVIELLDLSQSQPQGACLEALDEIGKLQEYSEKYKLELIPKFS